MKSRVGALTKSDRLLGHAPLLWRAERGALAQSAADDFAGVMRVVLQRAGEADGSRRRKHFATAAMAASSRVCTAMETGAAPRSDETPMRTRRDAARRSKRYPEGGAAVITGHDREHQLGVVDRARRDSMRRERVSRERFGGRRNEARRRAHSDDAAKRRRRAHRSSKKGSERVLRGQPPPSRRWSRPRSTRDHRDWRWRRRGG
jgi:hypothetical protein